jgi:hypothetical protein
VRRAFLVASTGTWQLCSCLFPSPHDLGRNPQTAGRPMKHVSFLRLPSELVFVDPLVLAIQPHANCSHISSQFSLFLSKLIFTLATAACDGRAKKKKKKRIFESKERN